MEIILSKDNVMRILCDRFNIEFVETSTGEVKPLVDKIFWEGNEKPVSEEKEEEK